MSTDETSNWKDAAISQPDLDPQLEVALEEIKRTLPGLEIYLHLITLSVTLLTLGFSVSYTGREQVFTVYYFVTNIGPILSGPVGAIVDGPEMAPGYLAAKYIGWSLWAVARAGVVVIAVESSEWLLQDRESAPIGVGILVITTLVLTGNLAHDVARGLLPAIGLVPISETLTPDAVAIAAVAVLATIVAIRRDRVLARWSQ